MSRPGLSNTAYQVGRQQLVEWLNDLLGLEYTKIEEAWNGAAYCQVMDAIHPGCVSLGRVSFDAASESAAIDNYKILQESFQRANVSHDIPLDALAKARAPAVIELGQWLHAHFQHEGGADDYDGPSRRREARCKAPASAKRAARRTPAVSPASSVGNGISREPQASGAATPGRKSGVHSSTSADSRGALRVKSPPPEESFPAIPPRPFRERRSEPRDDVIASLQGELKDLEKQRNFYFEKLRRIETFCIPLERTDPNIAQVLAILAEEARELGFCAPD